MQNTNRSVTVDAENDDVDVVFVPVDLGWEWLADDSGSGVGIWSELTVIVGQSGIGRSGDGDTRPEWILSFC